MKVKIHVELHNGAIRGNTIDKVLDVDEEDDIAYVVEDEINTNLISWDWEEVAP